MTEGRRKGTYNAYNPRAVPPSEKEIYSVAKVRSPSKRQIRFFSMQDGHKHVLGFFTLKEKFISRYIYDREREPEQTLAEELKASMVNLSEAQYKRLDYLLRTGHEKSGLSALINTPTVFLYDVLDVVTNDRKWELWKREFAQPI